MANVIVLIAHIQCKWQNEGLVQLGNMYASTAQLASHLTILKCFCFWLVLSLTKNCQQNTKCISAFFFLHTLLLYFLYLELCFCVLIHCLARSVWRKEHREKEIKTLTCRRSLSSVCQCNKNSTHLLSYRQQILACTLKSNP